MVSRALGLALVFVAAAPAFASFEVLLYTGPDRIYRYDPVNRISLGSFAQGQLFASNPILSLDPNNQSLVYAFGFDGGIRKFNWATGDYMGGFNIGTGYYSTFFNQMNVLSNGNLLINSTAVDVSRPVARIYSSTGTLLTTLADLGYDLLSTTLGADGKYYSIARLINGSNYNFYVFQNNSAGSYTGFSSIATGVSANYATRIQSDSNGLYIKRGDYPTLYRMNYGTSQALTAIASGGYITTGWAELVKGHFGKLHEVQCIYNSTTSNYDSYYYTYDPVQNSFGNYYQLPSTSYISSAALVTAPEPGEWLGLSVGLGALILRRRKAKLCKSA